MKGKTSSCKLSGLLASSIPAALLLLFIPCSAAAQPVEGPKNEDRSKTELPGEDSQQNYNLPSATFGGTQFWSDELVFHRWRIQRNAFTGHYRLLDGDDYRHAWGTFEQCKAKLDSIRREKELPPMKGPAVLTLHGLIRSRDVMEGIGQYLEEEGDLTWLNVSYASTRRSIDDHAESLAKVVDHLEGVDEVDFVCHSLGNLVVRRYLGEASQTQPKWKVDKRVKRFVMLGPPNNGAHLAEIFKDNELFGLLLGPSGKQIATWADVEKRMGIPTCEFGIIAGSLKGPIVNNPLVKGEDDLIVGVEETKLGGACDFCEVPLNHGRLMHEKDVQQKTLHFLKHGCFISEEKRQPIPAADAPGGGK